MTQELLKGSDNWVRLGSFVDSAGIVPVTNFTLSGADEKALLKHGNGAAVSISANSWVAIESADGFYNLLLTDSNCDTAGRLDVVVNDDSLALPVQKSFMVIDSSYWGMKYNDNAPALAAAISSLDVRVSSIGVEVDSVQAQITSNFNTLGTLPNSEALNVHILTLPTSEALNDHILTLPNSEELNAQILTLPDSEALFTHIATLPTSETLNIHALTLPTSEALNDHILTLPTSTTLEAQINTLPTSEDIFLTIGSLDVRVTSADTRVAGLNNLSTTQVYSEAAEALIFHNLDNLLKVAIADSSDLAAEVVDFSIMALFLAAGGDTSAFVSSADSLQALSEGAAAGGASVAEVESACIDALTGLNLHLTDVRVTSLDVRVSSVDVRVSSISAIDISTLPTSETLNAHIITLPSSETLNIHVLTLPTSQTLNTQIITLPNSETLNAHVLTLPDSSTLSDQVATLPTSEALNAHIITLPTSTTLELQINTLPTSGTVFDMVSSLDVRVSSISIQVSSVAVEVGTLPSSEALNAHMLTLPNSEVLNAHVITLPTSETLNAHVLTLPTSSTMLDMVSSVDARVLAVGVQVESLDTRVSSVGVQVGSVDAAVFAQVLEGTLTFAEKQRLELSVLTGISSGGGTSTLVFRDTLDTKDRIVCTVDSDGNRSAFGTRDGS